MDQDEYGVLIDASGRAVIVDKDQQLVCVPAGQEDVGQEDVGQEDIGQEEDGQEEVGQEDVGQEEVGQEEVGQEDVGQEDVGQEDATYNIFLVSFSKYVTDVMKEWGMGRGALDMWVDSRYAQHRPLAQNDTKSEKVGSKLYILMK